MAITFDKAVGMHESALKLRVARASMLSSNLANADTPNYKARDINFQEALSQKMAGTDNAGLKSTRAGHLGASNDILSTPSYYYRTPNQPSVDGNTVEESQEHAEFMKNNMEFQIAFTFLNSSFKALTKAIKGE